MMHFAVHVHVFAIWQIVCCGTQQQQQLWPRKKRQVEKYNNNNVEQHCFSKISRSTSPRIQRAEQNSWMMMTRMKEGVACMHHRSSCQWLFNSKLMLRRATWTNWILIILVLVCSISNTTRGRFNGPVCRSIKIEKIIRNSIWKHNDIAKIQYIQYIDSPTNKEKN